MIRIYSLLSIRFIRAYRVLFAGFEKYFSIWIATGWSRGRTRASAGETADVSPQLVAW
jgi:hypothetical protein